MDPHHQFQTSQHYNEYNLQGRNFAEGEDDEGVHLKGGVNGGKYQNKRKRVVDKKSDIIKGQWKIIFYELYSSSLASNVDV